MKRIAFFGGTFDPPHRGHIAIAKAAADHFALDEILFAPVASQPLKEHSSATPFLHRYAMTVLATQADSRFIPSLIDGPQANRPNYTADTLAGLRSSFGEEISLFTLLGADNWLQIARWHNAPRLLSLTDWIVAARPGFSLDSAQQAVPPQVTAKQQHGAEPRLLLNHANASSTNVFFLPNTHVEISATELRSALNAGNVAPDLLPATVQEYIRKTDLYHADAQTKL